MKEGDVVYNEYHNIRRYGIIEKKTIKDDGWGYCAVKWFNDEIYEDRMADRQKLTNKNWALEEYRVDMLLPIDLHKELSTLEDIRHELNTRGQGGN